MRFSKLWRRYTKQSKPRLTRSRLCLEHLEDRVVPANFTASTVPELIADINAANLSAEADTITLAPGKNFSLSAVNNSDSNGATVLPVIAASGGSLTVLGGGDVIQRNNAKSTPTFRLFNIASGASLTLENLTLQGGSTRVGGAIINFGALTMTDVTVQKNTGADGGGIYSTGSVTLQDCIIHDNQAIGADGHPAIRFRDPFDPHNSWEYVPPGAGGWGLGGGLFIADGTAELLGTSVTSNSAVGGKGGQGKGGQPNAPDGFGQGGGIYIASNAAVTLDAYTVAHVTANTADFDRDIFGTFATS